MVYSLLLLLSLLTSQVILVEPILPTFVPDLESSPGQYSEPGPDPETVRVTETPTTTNYFAGHLT